MPTALLQFLTVAILLSLTSTPAFAAGPDGAIACASQPGPGDVADVDCAIASAPVARTLRFKADFVGSHDDTVLAMMATLDGAPLVCRDGSTTRRVGEDGEVSLDCAFAVPADAAARFGAHVTFHHAQSVGMALTVQ